MLGGNVPLTYGTTGPTGIAGISGPVNPPIWALTGSVNYYSAGNVSIGKTTNQYALDVSGGLNLSSMIINNFPVHLLLTTSTITYYNSAGATGFTANVHNYLKFENTSVSKNWTPSYTNTTRLVIPYEGLYLLKFQTSYTNAGDVAELFITKNTNNNNDLNSTADKLLANGIINASYALRTTLTTLCYLTTSDYINYGFYAGSSNAPLNASKSSFTATLIQRTL
jgi:hypothetical protein